MIRILLTQLFLFLLPFIAYAAYLFLSKKMNRQAWVDAPRYWLIMAGLAVSLTGFMILTQVNNNPTGGVYVPAHMEDGKLVRGKIKPLPVEPQSDQPQPESKSE